MPMPGLAILIAKKKGAPMGDESMEHDGGDDGHSKQEVCQKITETLIDAIHDRDARAACRCLSDLVSLLKDDTDEEDAEQGSDDDS